MSKTLDFFLKDESVDFEIIVVDQSDEIDAGVIDLADKRGDKIRLFRVKKKGLPHARNYGVSKASSDCVIFCDDDVVPQPGFVAGHLRNFVEDHAVGCVGGRVVFNKKALNGIKHFSKVGRFREWDGRITDNFDAAHKQPIDHAQGCNMSFRKELIVRAGGFDERFGGSSHLEETDMCVRIKHLGFKAIYEPAAALIHLKDPSGGCRAEDYRDWFYWFGHNYSLFFLKNAKPLFFPVFIATRVAMLIFSAIKRSNIMIVGWGLRGFLDGALAYFKAGR